LSSSKIEALPDYIKGLQNLQTLDLSHAGKLTSLPEDIGFLHKFEVLNLNYSGISLLPSSMGNLLNLKDLNLFQVKLSLSLQDNLGDLTNLQVLIISKASSGWICARCFQFITVAYGRENNNIHDAPL
jgi:Leucine-rich repeat (LRR) protein